MSALTLTLREQPGCSLDMSLLSPHRLAGLEKAAVGALPLSGGNRRQRLSDLFDISGEDAQELVIVNSSKRLLGIGTGMTSGTIRIEGDAGDHLGENMHGGFIEVTGNAGHWTGSGMREGMILIAGDCGDFAGGALPGNRHGMRGGTLLVRGNSGDRTGDHLRRGCILVEGNSGAFCGSRMVAGTIAVLGQVGPRAGFAMQRGTLLLSETPEQLPPTLNDCGEHELGFLSLLMDSFAALSTRFADSGNSKNRVRRYVGDLAVNGKGELLVWV
ncbi:MAG TPA: formylmethanofuran dehydrogenase subunit C [Gammaproteobacteria bacterium]|nr:formylmethanofuran dehydrogenase subunit C [Gammaproteobacteria bacterium]